MIGVNSSKNDVLAAVSQNGWALHYAREELKKSQEFFK